MTPHALWVDTPVYRDAGKTAVLRRQRYRKVCGMIRRHNLPPSWCLSSAPFTPKGTTRVLHVGDSLDDVRVEAAHSGSGFLICRVGEFEPDADADAKRRQWGRSRKRSREIKAGDQVTGVVVEIRGYGLLVDFGGAKNGLVHVTSISDARKNKGLGWVDGLRGLKSLFETGDELPLKVLKTGWRGVEFGLHDGSWEREKEGGRVVGDAEAEAEADDVVIQDDDLDDLDLDLDDEIEDRFF